MVNTQYLYFRKMLAFTRRMDPPRCVHLRYGPHPTISLSYLLSPSLPIDFMVGETTHRPGYAPPPPLPRPCAASAASPATRRRRAPATRRLCLRRCRAPAMPTPPHTSQRRRLLSLYQALPSFPSPSRALGHPSGSSGCPLPCLNFYDLRSKRE
jgi:hypothetical protein